LAQAYKDGCTKPGFWYTEGYDWYGTKGDTNDWAYGAWSDLDTTIELNTQKTPSASQIPTYTAQHRQAVINYMMKVFQGIHGVMTDQVTGAPLDGTVTVTATASSSIPVPHSFQAVFTDPVAGDFHRLLQPGTYTVLCSAPGYVTTTITGVVVNADTKTVTDCAMILTGCAGAALSAPAELANLQFPTKTSASWDASADGGPGLAYDVARGTLGQWPAGSGADEICVEQHGGSNVLTIADVPDVDSGSWYLVRATTACGLGSYGDESGGAPRNVSICP
jgi:hypothetical protein